MSYPTAHEWMLELVKAAEELGYGIRAVGVDSISLTRPSADGYADVDIRGQFVNGELLRRTLLPVEPKETP